MDKAFTSILFILVVVSGLGFFSSRIVEMPDRSMLRGWDNSWYYFWGRSILLDGDIDFSNEVMINNTIASKDIERSQNMPLTENGYIPNKYGIGVSLVSLPFITIAHVLTLVSNQLGFLQLEADGFSYLYQLFFQFGNLLIAIYAIFILYKILCLFFDSRSAKAGTLIGWAGSMMLYYQTVNFSMAHHLTFSLCIFIYYQALKIYKKEQVSFTSLLIIALCSGLILVTRYQAAIYLLFPFIIVVMLLFRNQFSVYKWIIATLIFLIPISLQMWAWQILYGDFIVFSYGHEDESFFWDAPFLMDVLFSSNHGLFYWHPLLLLGLVSYLFALLKLKLNLLFLTLFSTLLMWYLNGSWHCWWLGSSFGMRNFECITIFSCFGIAYLFSISTKRAFKAGIFTLCSLLLVWNINICLLYTTNIISRNGSVPYHEMIKSSSRMYGEIIPSYLKKTLGKK